MSFTNNISLAQATDRTSFRMSYTNTDLKPESTTSFEVGLEAAFLNDRIGFDLTYYKTTTTILEEQVEVMETYYDNFSECQSGCCPS